MWTAPARGQGNSLGHSGQPQKQYCPERLCGTELEQAFSQVFGQDESPDLSVVAEVLRELLVIGRDKELPMASGAAGAGHVPGRWRNFRSPGRLPGRSQGQPSENLRPCRP